MGKRPYYIITHNVEYEGYSDYIDYIGYNLPAAIERFKFLWQDLRRQYYENEGIDDERINGNFPAIDIEALKAMRSNTVTAYLNDDDQCWISVTLHIINTGTFLRSDGRDREERYKLEHPNAKY